MSSNSSQYGTTLIINNNLKSNLYGGVKHISSGHLVGVFPDKINGDGHTTQIQIDSTDGNAGSQGRFTYKVVVGGHERDIYISFVCNNSLQNSVTAGSPTATLFDMSVTGYSQGDTPLNATVTLSQRN